MHLITGEITNAVMERTNKHRHHHHHHHHHHQQQQQQH